MSGSQQDITALMAMVTMPISRWNQVLEVLGGQPWKDINPLIVDIHRQIQDAVNAQHQGNQQQPAMARE
jgi:hypothetical protein